MMLGEVGLRIFFNGLIAIWSMIILAMSIGDESEVMTVLRIGGGLFLLVGGTIVCWTLHPF